MTILVNKTVRDALNIDTLERGLVYSALLLRASNTLNTPIGSGEETIYTNAVQLVTENVALDNGSIFSIIDIHGKFPYNNQVALKHGGNFLTSLKVFSNDDPNPFLLTCNPTPNNILPIPAEPPTVDTLEKYFVWCAQNLCIGLLNKNPSNIENITFKFLEEDSNGPSLDIEVIMPFDLKVFYTEDNLMNAVKQIVSNLTESEAQLFFNNVIAVNNQMSVGNT